MQNFSSSPHEHFKPAHAGAGQSISPQFLINEFNESSILIPVKVRSDGAGGQGLGVSANYPGKDDELRQASMRIMRINGIKSESSDDFYHELLRMRMRDDVWYMDASEGEGAPMSAALILVKESTLARMSDESIKQFVHRDMVLQAVHSGQAVPPLLAQHYARSIDPEKSDHLPALT